MSAPRCIDHVAFPCFDVVATLRFWTEVMQLRVVDATVGESEPWGGRFLHLCFATPEGGAVSFFGLAGLARPADDGLPEDIRHLALRLGSAAEVGAWKRRLEEHGVAVRVEDHGGYASLYFSDPNGLVVELAEPSYDAGSLDLRRVREVVRRWAGKDP